MFHWKGKILFGIALIAGVAILGFTSQYKHVTIKADGKEIETVTMKKSVGELLEEKEIELTLKDKVSEDLHAPIVRNMEIEVIRAFPVSIEVDSETIGVFATPSSVAEILAEAGIKVGQYDKVVPKLETEITKTENIKITRVAYKEEIKKETVKYDTEYKEDSKLDAGATKILKEGKNGEKEIKYLVTSIDGKITDRAIVEEKVLTEPENRIIAKGTRKRIMLPETASRSYNSSMTVVATAYTHTGNPTSTGVMPKRGTIAVDPKVIPMGKKLYVEGYGSGIAQDTGGAIKGNKIDVFMDTNGEARKWGRRTVKVYFVD